MGDIPAILATLLRLEATMMSARGDITDRIGRVQDVVETMRDDITVNFARADRVGQVATGVSAEVRALCVEVSAMERQLRRLRTDFEELKRPRG